MELEESGPLRPSNNDLQEAINEVFTTFVENFPPAASRQENQKDMTTAEIFEMINSHCPDAITPAKLVTMLREKGYISNYDPADRQFCWLIRT